MPELPEVEVTRRSVGGMAGARVLAMQMGKPLRWPLGVAPASLVGLIAGTWQRRGKYLWLPLMQAEGASAGGLLWHLGMSGSLSFTAAPGPAGKHDHAEITTERGVLRLTDPRRFGAVVWSPALDMAPAAKLLAGLGVEPFDTTFGPADFHAALRGRRTPIKQVLLAGDIVVGAGNIYASDALFEAGIDPRAPAARIGPLRAGRLLAAVRQVLAEAIDAGGSTLRDFRDAHGSVGQYQGQARVYGRAGEACSRCGGIIQRIVQGQRATYFCPGCQRR
ncbi:MAG TPA: bifunctional DNA-formamidopyrimidine glycosylase/DNA-(apurinic or apyrimidinic site) lyase [Ideonella sp.]|uniref:bifunctional DNA-formamidopyrimidine glycosylase/DNA-(apurinic or apyrimidinic site) lyase n=1 Tax=Ideonella sp. TaxID=1929293 RepID=UPI002CC861E3|nr:bifunctional DNA-formamidopyrimidine glycosylase/DNA-(apurinic or apyrimidinic site) lyase [Ideonella sp.]HSI48949.1 bifunctional DNA-formamidopyrimidine glycosylase/DNA-(apurinic or apyrimidinic site) lyase [Ideonella sp.]